MGAFLWMVMAGIVAGLNEAPVDRIAQPKSAWVKPIQAALGSLASSRPAAATASPTGQGAPAKAKAAAPNTPATQARSIASAPATASAVATESSTVFAVIGDFGTGNRDAKAVAGLVASWKPEYLVTVGDNYYANAGGRGSECFANSVGKLYGDWTAGALYPALGNHDYDVEPAPASYTDYFSLPGDGFESSSGNERYYDFTRGPVHFFVLNSNPEEPHGVGKSSRQGRWLKEQLAKSTAKFNVVVVHHPPYSSGDTHGPSEYMRWPFAEWGADVVLAGHDHAYERVVRDDIVYFVNGAGGVARYGFGKPVRGSACRYSGDFGAQKVTVTDSAMTLEFYSVGGGCVDSYEVKAK